MKEHYIKIEATDTMWISLYAMIVDKRASHLTKAVASGKCKAEFIPTVNRTKHRELIGSAMYELDRAT